MATRPTAKPPAADEATADAKNAINLVIDGKQLASAYASGAPDELVRAVVQWCLPLAKLNLLKPRSAVQQHAVDESLSAIAFYLTRGGLNLKRSHLIRLLQTHSVLTNFFALSSHGGTDRWLRQSLTGGRAALATFFFANSRCEQAVPRAALFDIDPEIASEWFGQYFTSARGYHNPVVRENLRQHLRFWDDRMRCRWSVSNGYMQSTYIDPAADRIYKQRFNQLVQRRYADFAIRNRPRGNRIAVVTGRWSKVNPTYKNRYPLFKALAERYSLSLVHVGPPRKDLEQDIFDDTHHVQIKGERMDTDFLFDNDYDMVFYPDIGMNVESRFLSNLRLAPIQLTTNSHPVSTFGSQIDYFVTGAESEESPSLASQHYSERLVLIPGIGTHPVQPQYVPKSPKKPADPLLVACGWGSLKFNDTMLRLLRQILDRASRRVVFRFLPTLKVDSGGYLVFLQDLQAHLGEAAVQLYPSQPYDKYMDRLAECTLALDPFPFGGNTTIVDCMALRLPIVTRCGWQFYNLAGPVMQARFGVRELSARTDDEYVEMALRLIDDADFRQRMTDSIDSNGFEERLASLSSAGRFVDAMTHLMEKRPEPGDRSPLVFT